MTRAVARLQSLIRVRRIAEVPGARDFHLVVLNLTIAGRSNIGDPGVGGAAETGVGDVLREARRDCEGEGVGTGGERLIGEDVVIGSGKVIVTIEVNPGAQVAGCVGVHDNGHRLADVERGGEGHAILIVVARTGTEDRTAGVGVVVNGAIRLTIPLRIHAVAQVDIVGAEAVTRTVVRLQRYVVSGRQVAPVVGVLDAHILVILDLAVVGLAGGLIYGSRRAAEAGVGRAGYGCRGDCEG